MRTCEECKRTFEGHGDARGRWHLVDGTLVDGATVSHDFCTAACLASYAGRKAADEQHGWHVVTEPSDTGPEPFTHQAACPSCGWEGPQRAVHEVALEDGRDHAAGVPDTG